MLVLVHPECLAEKIQELAAIEDRRTRMAAFEGLIVALKSAGAAQGAAEQLELAFQEAPRERPRLRLIKSASV